MYFDRTYKNLSFKYAYLIASQISEIIMSNDSEENINEYLWFFAKSPEEYFIELLTDNITKLINPSKDTLLHQFISDVFNMSINKDIYWFKDDFYNQELEDVESYIYKNYIQRLEYYGIETQNLFSIIRKICRDYKKEVISQNEYEEKIKDKVDGIAALFDKIEDSVVNEVFYLLFNDKMLLLKFNMLLSEYIRRIDVDKYTEIFDKSHNLVRCNYIPEWLKKAVYFRDNGTCQHCGKDLSGSVRINEDREKQYDHIIPLEKGGSNDPTNFQLLCADCNLKKLGKIVIPRNYYQYYW